MYPPQIKIGDCLLNYLVENGGKSNKDFYPGYLRSQGFTDSEFHQVIELLKDEKLVEVYGQDEYRLRLTDKGEKSAKIGLEKYFDKKNSKENSQERHNLLSNWLRAIGILVTIGGLLLGLKVCKNGNDKNDGQNTSNHGTKERKIITQISDSIPKIDTIPKPIYHNNDSFPQR
jgi:hypothetical protein